MSELIAAAEKIPPPRDLLDVDHPALLLPGNLASLINRQLLEQGGTAIKEDAEALPVFASLIFHSLAHRYGQVLRDVARLTGRQLEQIYVVGGGSLNSFLNRLTVEATGMPLSCGVVESSTIGNFAVQLAALEGASQVRDRIRHWAGVLTSSAQC